MFASQQDIIIGSVLIVMILLTTVLGQWAVRQQYIKAVHVRKCLQLIATCAYAFAINRFDDLRLLAYLLLLLAVVLGWTAKKGWLQVGTSKNYGMALFPLAFFVLLLCPGFEKESTMLVLLVSGISGVAAGWVDNQFTFKHHLFLYETKSWLGFGVFYITTFVIALVFIGIYDPIGWLFCYAFALVPALTGLFAYRSSDHFTTPLMAALWYYLLQNVTLEQLIGLILFSLLLCLLSLAAVYKKWLLPGGAAAAAWMGLLFFAADGYRAMALPTLFLITGSLLSKLNGEKQEAGGRSAVQVFANGIVGAVCLILYQLLEQEIYLLAAIMSFAVSMADTVSAEAGKYWRGKTWDVLTRRPVTVGLSGGISMGGTLAGLVAAFVLAAVAGWLYALQWSHIVWIAAVGFMGMLVDSVLGSRWQALYQQADGSFTEVAGQDRHLVKGRAWCTNHTVNLLSNTLIISLIILFFCVRLLL